MLEDGKGKDFMKKYFIGWAFASFETENSNLIFFLSKNMLLSTQFIIK